MTFFGVCYITAQVDFLLSFLLFYLKRHSGGISFPLGLFSISKLLIKLALIESSYQSRILMRSLSSLTDSFGITCLSLLFGEIEFDFQRLNSIIKAK
jgi:hypothetical protein